MGEFSQAVTWSHRLTGARESFWSQLNNIVIGVLAYAWEAIGNPNWLTGGLETMVTVFCGKGGAGLNPSRINDFTP